MLNTIVRSVLNFLYRFRKKRNGETKKILFLFPSSAVGDTIVETFFIREVKKLFPQAALDIFILKPSVALLQDNPHVNRIFTMPVNKYKKLLYLAISPLFLRPQHYDLLLDLPHSGYAPFRQILLYLIGASKTMSCNVQGYHFITYPLDWEECSQHITQAVYVKALQLLGAKGPFSIQYELYLPTSCQQKINDFWQRYGLEGKKVLLFNTEGSSRVKTLSNQRVAEIIKKIRARFPSYQILLLAYKKDFSELTGEVPVLYSSSLLVTAAAIQRADYVLTVDTGITHMADVYHKKMCVLFSQTVQDKFRPCVCDFWGSVTDTTVLVKDKKQVDSISDEDILSALEKNLPV